MPTCFIFMPLGGMCFDHTKSRKIARKWHSEFVGPGPLRLIIWLSPAEAEFNVVHSGILNTLSCRSNIRVNSPSSLLGGEIENSTFSLHGNCFNSLPGSWWRARHWCTTCCRCPSLGRYTSWWPSGSIWAPATCPANSRACRAAPRLGPDSMWRAWW